MNGIVPIRGGAMPEQITLADAVKLAKTIAADRFKADDKMATTQRKEAEKAVGGQVTEFDASVIAQGRQWMQRLAFLSRSLDKSAGSTGYQSTSKSGDKIRKLVPEIASIVAQLEALQLTDPQIGLFKEPVKRDYEVQEWRFRNNDNGLEAGDDASVIVGMLEVRNPDLAEQLEDALKGRVLIEEPKKQTALPSSKKGRGKGKKQLEAAAGETPVTGVESEDEPVEDPVYSEDPDASDHAE